MKDETTGKEEFYFEDLPEHAQEVMIELIADIVRVMKSNPNALNPKKKAKRERNPNHNKVAEKMRREPTR